MTRLFEEAECVDWAAEGRKKDIEVWRVFEAACKDKDLLRSRVKEVKQSGDPGSDVNKSRVLAIASVIDASERDTRDSLVAMVDTGAQGEVGKAPANPELVSALAAQAKLIEEMVAAVGPWQNFKKGGDQHHNKGDKRDNYVHPYVKRDERRRDDRRNERRDDHRDDHRRRDKNSSSRRDDRRSDRRDDRPRGPPACYCCDSTDHRISECPTWAKYRAEKKVKPRADEEA